jgi:DNA modification methylase
MAWEEIKAKGIKLYYESETICIINADCREVLPSLPKVDLVLTDPPYGIKADKDNAHSSIRDNPKWPESKWDYERQPEGVKMALQNSCNMAVFGGNYYTDILPVSSGWLAWLKPQASTGFSLADMELCWTSLNIAARTKTFNRRDGNYHPTQKPVCVMLWVLSFFPNITDILDPFMGSGTTLLAAKQLGRKAIGIEISEKYCEIAVKRLAQSVMDLNNNGDKIGGEIK